MKAYLDTFSGLVPCKVIAINDTFADNPQFKGRTSSCAVTVKLTAKRGAYKRGEVIQSNALHVVPRNFVFRSSGQFRIRGGYSWAIN